MVSDDSEVPGVATQMRGMAGSKFFCEDISISRMPRLWYSPDTGSSHDFPLTVSVDYWLMCKAESQRDFRLWAKMHDISQCNARRFKAN
ncbi:hypothetical protein Unana1_01650 [Umbelopsis nana]